MKRRFIYLPLLLCLLSFPARADQKAQDTPSSSEIEIDVDSEIRLNDGSIEAEGMKTDADYQNYLSRLFEMIKSLEGVQIRVEQKLTILEGEVQNLESRRMASQIVEKVKGLIGVVNNIKVSKPDSINLKPAADEVSAFSAKLSKNIPYVVSAIIVFIVFSLLGYGVFILSRTLLRKNFSSPLFVNALARIISAPVFLVGFYLMVVVTGLDGLAATVVGGTGLVGLLIGLSLKGAAENYISSLMISLKKTFTRGDLVEIGNHQGLVHSVTTSGTTLIDYDGNHIIIPNSKVFAETVTNYTVNPKTRLSFVIGIGYEDSIERARELIMEEMKALGEKILSEPEPQILVESLGSSTVNIKSFFWVDIQKISQFKVQSLLLQRIKETFVREGVSMPDDAREIIFPQPLKINMLKGPQKSLDEEASRNTRPKQSDQNEHENDHEPNAPDLDSEIQHLKQQGDDQEMIDEKENLL